MGLKYSLIFAKTNQNEQKKKKIPFYLRPMRPLTLKWNRKTCKKFVYNIGLFFYKDSQQQIQTFTFDATMDILEEKRSSLGMV